MKVLIADDHELVRRGLRQLVGESEKSAQIGEARSYQEVVEAVAKGGWDVVVLDIDMPGRSGLEALAEIKRRFPDLPVIMLSVHPEAEYAVRALKLGASGYLNKGSAADELLIALKKVRAGGRYVTARLAELLAATIGGGLDQLPHESLSARELQVLQMVAKGMSLKQIAGELGLSEKTVGTYRTRVGEKMGLRTNVELARYALQHRLVS